MNRRRIIAGAIGGAVAMPSLISAQTPTSSDSEIIEMLRIYVEVAQATGDVSVLDTILHPDVFDPDDPRTLPGIEAFKQGILDGYYWRQDMAWKSEGPLLENAITADNVVSGVAVWSGQAGSNLREFRVPYLYFITLKDSLFWEVRRASNLDDYNNSLTEG